MGDNNPFSGADSIDEIASILGALDPGMGAKVQGGNRQGQRASERSAPVDDAEPVDDDDTSDDDADLDPDGATDGDEDTDTAADDDDESEEADDEEDDEEPSYTVKIDGKEHTVTLSELTAGYQRHRDYTRKSQELADQRRNLETEVERVRTGLSGATEQANARVARLDEAITALDGLFKEPDYDAIAAQHGEQAAFRQKRLYDAAMAKVNTAKEARAKAQKEAQEQAQADAQAEAQRALASLPQVIPEWSDHSVARADLAGIADYWRSIGGDPAVLNQVYDPKIFRVLRDAAKLHRTKGTGENVRKTKKVVKPMKVQRPGSVTAADREKVSSQKRTARRNQAFASGDINEIVAALAG